MADAAFVGDADRDVVEAHTIEDVLPEGQIVQQQL
ncbi:hypothetical protein ABIB00_003467 [Bradyrhizobium sp. LB14.3]